MTSPSLIEENKVSQWLQGIVENADFNVEFIDITDSAEWSYKNGAIAHNSGRFFSVVGCKGLESGQTSILLKQREIGTLGFLLLEGNEKNRLLVQAKIEPGNMNVCQMAPTFQATESNLECVHGGKRQFLEEIFVNPKTVIYDTLNSEQGTRFFCKLNRNVMISINDDSNIELLENYRWFDVETVCDSLIMDHHINTDARSVLVSSPWKELIGRDPFTRHDDELSNYFRSSYAKIRKEYIDQVISDIDIQREKAEESIEISIDELTDWEMTPSGISSKESEIFSVRYIDVNTQTREVPHWDQPIVESHGEGRADIYCQLRDGIMYFLFRPQSELGLINKVELGPSFIYEPGVEHLSPSQKGEVIASVRQSDEGGRFFKDVTLYQLIQIDELENETDSDYWLTLGELQDILLLGGYSTNEARSALSLILKWL